MKTKKYFGKVTILLLVVMILLEALTIFEITNYENGFLELYALEQDGYVQVTVDQIKRLGADATEAAITDIISSIDANSSKYWTLNTGDNILFVKSVTETNRYKNYSADSYYSSDSAKDFVNSLSEDKVSHSVIMLEDERYVASGVLFSWHGNQYRICLLTFDKAILEKNELLQSKYAVLVMTTLVLIISFVLCLFLVKTVDEKNRTILEDSVKEQYLNSQLAYLDHAYRLQETYSAAQNVFSQDVLDKFLHKLEEKSIRPLYFALYEARDQEALTDFLKNIQVLLDESVLRFRVREKYVLLIFAGFDESMGEKYVSRMMDYGIELVGTRLFEDYYDSYYDQYHKFEEEMLSE